MKKLDNDKHSFDKKTLVKLAPAAVVIAAVAAAGVQIKGEVTNTAAEAKSIVKSQDITSLLNTAYFSEETEENSGITAKATLKSKDTKKKSSSKKTTKTAKKKNGGIKKGSVKTLPTKTAAASGQGQGTTTTPTTEIPEGGYKDGVYQGSGTGFGGTITVQVTVSGGQITAVDVLSAAGETGSYFSSARGVISEVLSSQSPNVDAISGATYSSNGIIQAVQNALSQAGSTGSTEITPTPTPSPKPTKTPKPGKTDNNITYKDGVYEGAAEGFDGTVTVKVTIKKGKIKKITNTNTDTAEFFNKAWKNIKAEIISRQSVSGIDTVSGATFSSNGILGAVSQALAKAQESGNAGTGTADGKNDGNNSSDPENTITPIPTQTPGTDEAPGNSDSPSDAPQTPENPSEPGTLLKDGVYTASAQGYSGEVVITITVKDGKITEISNTNTDTRTFFNKVWRRLQPKILEKQDTEGIDTVSGATFSSQGILNASKLAIEQAKNTEEPSPTVTPKPTKTPEATPTPAPTKTPEQTPTVTPEPTKTPEETPAPSPEPTMTPEPAETPQPTKAPEETPTPQPTQTPASEYKDGTYTGIGEGNDGPDSVQVTVTIQGGKLVNAVYNTYDDEDFFEPAWEGILSQVLGKQSAEGIDTVSGSTYSSLGIIKAFQNALKQAKGV